MNNLYLYHFPDQHLLTNQDSSPPEITDELKPPWNRDPN